MWDDSCSSAPFLPKAAASIMSYIVCRYDGKWCIDMILELDCEKNDARVTFMHPHGPAKSFYWPN